VGDPEKPTLNDVSLYNISSNKQALFEKENEKLPPLIIGEALVVIQLL
jgi:hypothetical protein